MSMNDYLGDYLCRPAICHGEGLYGYLLRFAGANHMRGIYALSRTNGLLVRELVDKYRLQAAESKGNANCGNFLHTAVRGKRTRICPCCMRDANPFARAEWDLPLYLRCRQHNCLLLDRCTACSRAITHYRNHLEKCNCGMKFSEMKEQSVPKWVEDIENTFLGVDDQCSYAMARTRGLKAARQLRSFAQAKSAGRVQKSGVMRTVGILNSDVFPLLEKCFGDSKVGFPHEYLWHFLVKDNCHYQVNRLRHIEEFPRVASEVARLYSETITSCNDLFGVRSD